MIILRRPAASIRKLSNFARRLDVEKGNSVEIDAFSSEIRDLGESLNAASIELKATETQLLQEREQLISALNDRDKAQNDLCVLNSELEERVRARTKQLEAANQELESFSYSVSHDLRSPLRHIEGFSTILVEDYADRFDGEGRQCLEQIRKSTLRMGELIDVLLKLSRVGRNELHLTSVDLSQVAREIAQELSSANPERRVVFEIKDEIRVYADRPLMRVVLENLLGNAWKYSSHREVSLIQFGNISSESGETVFVRDNGSGFDMQYADKLFKPFQRLHSADQFEGIGIGLATVMRIINRHGGTIWSEAAPDQGATFYFSLPSHSVP
jgi:light-regulated signal transduction histidine kinase (bacteriophytochrome)